MLSWFEGDDNLASCGSERFSRARCEGETRPSPRVNSKAYLGEGFTAPVRIDPGFLNVSRNVAVFNGACLVTGTAVTVALPGTYSVSASKTATPGPAASTVAKEACHTEFQEAPIQFSMAAPISFIRCSGCRVNN